jgi:uncharacterized membrane protein (DUF485 family)
MTHKTTQTPAVPPASRPAVKIPNPESSYVLPPWHAAHDEQINFMIARHVAEVNAARQQLEDIRAIRRNRNRFASLLGALFISLVLTFTFQHGYLGSRLSANLSPYAFVITITLDSAITLYAYLKRY